MVEPLTACPHILCCISRWWSPFPFFFPMTPSSSPELEDVTGVAACLPAAGQRTCRPLLSLGNIFAEDSEAARLGRLGRRRLARCLARMDGKQAASFTFARGVPKPGRAGPARKAGRAKPTHGSGRTGPRAGPRNYRDRVVVWTGAAQYLSPRQPGREGR